jgi:hypothetical protein
MTEMLLPLIRPAISKKMGTEMNTMHNAAHLSILAVVALVSLGSMAEAQQRPQAPNMSFFVTSVGSGNDADLGDVARADAHCQQLAAAAGAGGKTWHAYLSRSANAPGGRVTARDRIGSGPWQNAKGEVIAKNVDDLYANPNINTNTALTERGTMVAGVGMTPNWHDALTGSTPDGSAFITIGGMKLFYCFAALPGNPTTRPPQPSPVLSPMTPRPPPPPPPPAR